VTPQHIGLFLDRDGTINQEVDFLSKPEEVILIPKAADAIREANELGLKVCIVSNQSGIARGLLTTDDLERVNARLTELLANEGARIDGIYYCPHHPDVGPPLYRKECTCRKPKTGMIIQAAREHSIDLHSSYVIGDRCIDVQAGHNAGCGTVLVLTGYGRMEKDECLQTMKVGHIADDLYQGWVHIKTRVSSKHVGSQREV